MRTPSSDPSTRHFANTVEGLLNSILPPRLAQATLYHPNADDAELAAAESHLEAAMSGDQHGLDDAEVDRVRTELVKLRAERAARRGVWKPRL